jgi:hypothetical protein
MKPILAKACCEMSRRDGAIVAWHEVPGTAPPQKEPSRRVWCDSRRFGHRFDDWSDEISATIGVVPTGRACRHFATASS